MSFYRAITQMGDMTLLHVLVLTQFLYVPTSFCVRVEVTGDVSFDVVVKHLGRERALDDLEGKERVVTVGPVLECPYQYPDVEQFNAMLSNMMNELTKVFMRVNELMVRGDGRRKQGSRFTIVEKKNKNFFEDIYSNMTREYTYDTYLHLCKKSLWHNFASRSFFNSTSMRVGRTAQDPCSKQEELKDVWRSLLERSLGTLRRAAMRCVQEYLREQGRAEDHRTKYKLGQFLLSELARVRTSQLHTLCDHFQLCYSDLL